jgi:hypothetical protein
MRRLAVQAMFMEWKAILAGTYQNTVFSIHLVLGRARAGPCEKNPKAGAAFGVLHLLWEEMLPAIMKSSPT